MDGPHDLGGKDGFGPIDVAAPPFRAEWEARQWALTKNVDMPPRTLDWWRFGLENMDPVTYLSIPYFAKWCLNDLAQTVDGGVFTLDEIITGEVAERGDPAPTKSPDELMDQLRANAIDYSRDMARPPIFSPGDRVRTQRIPSPGHTRLPAYARGAVGTIIAHHGGHIFPDASAKGVEEPEHIYTVEFSARELWGPETSTADTVCIDLWEPYLAAA